MADIQQKLQAELEEAEFKAWDSLSRYKFQMFGYWAAIWVHLNRLGEFRRPNPWSRLVHQAKETRQTHVRSDCELLESPYSAVTMIDDERPEDWEGQL